MTMRLSAAEPECTALRLLAAWCCRLVLLVAAATCFASSAAARQVALVVGIGGYDKVAELRNPIRDATFMAARLRDLRFEVVEALEADRVLLRRSVARFLERARGADLALVFFAGHGLQLFDRNVLLARDADPTSAREIGELGLDLTELMADIRAAAPVRSVLIVDACRDNPLGFEATVALLQRLFTSAGRSPTGEMLAEAAGWRGLARVALPPKAAGAGELLTFFSAQPGQVALDGAGTNSYFVEGLREALAQPERPLDVIFRSASAYVRTVTNGRQVPQIVSDWTGDVTLGRSATARVRYLNTSLGEQEARTVGEAARALPRFGGAFIARESQSFVATWRAADAATRRRADALGRVNGFAIDYDLDRDGREESIAAYVMQSNAVLEVVDEGVSVIDTPCFDFERGLDGGAIEAVEIALRDLDGDGRPEIFVHYQPENEPWGPFCVLRYKGAGQHADLRRGPGGRRWAGADGLFEVLLKDRGETVTVGADNGIEACAGSNCHARSAWRFDGTHFRQTLDESEPPSPAKALPFRNEAERARNIGPVAPPPAPALSPPSAVAPAPAAPAEPRNRTLAEIEAFVTRVYLPAGNSERPGVEPVRYVARVDYYGKVRTEAEVRADKAAYFARWPRRRYGLVPGSLRVATGAGGDGQLLVTFDYTFEVSSQRRRSAGVGRARLGLLENGGTFLVEREEGEVLQRR
jgi:hypothetical protein